MVTMRRAGFTPGGSLGAGSLLWKAFLGWLKQIFFKQEQRGDS